jgi:diguanylate cyclase (GGDEF)-like protein/PAS domain S-box-containing protein
VNLSELHFNWSLGRRIALALVIFLVALVLRLLVIPVEDGIPYLTFYPAMVLGFYLCGRVPGYVVTLLSAVTGYFLFIKPAVAVGVAHGDIFALIFFLLSAYIVSRVMARLQETASHLQQLFDNSPTGLITIEPKSGRVIASNRAARSLWNLDADEFTAKTAAELTYRDDWPALSKHIAELCAGSPSSPHAEVRFIKSDGSPFWAASSLSAIKDARGEVQYLIGSASDISERKSLEHKLVAAAHEIEDLYDNAPCGYHSLGPDGTFQRINATELSWFGCKREDLIGRIKPTEFFAPESVELFKKRYPEFLRQGHIEGLEFDIVAKDGTKRHVVLSATALKDENGQFVMSRSVMYDITELHQARVELQRLSLEQTAMLDNELVGIMKVRDRRIQWANKALSRISGYEQTELLGKEARSLYVDQNIYNVIGEGAAAALKGEGTYRTQLTMVRKDDEQIWVDLNGMQLPGTNGESLWMIVDIAEMMKQRERVEQLAYHDYLTGLPNRPLFIDRLEQQIAVSKRISESLAVCFIDLDDFKQVNDTHGHAVGDELLKEAANRIQHCVRVTDTVCRLGGDEFALLLTKLDSESEHIEIVERIVKAIRNPFVLPGGKNAQVTVSVGIATYPHGGANCETLLEHADQAMYCAKQAGRNGVCVYGSPQNDCLPLDQATIAMA